MNTTEYVTTKRTTVHRASTRQAPKVASPEAETTIETLGQPGGPKGMLEMIRPAGSEWVLLDGLVPAGMARMVAMVWGVYRA